MVVEGGVGSSRDMEGREKEKCVKKKKEAES